LGALFGGGDLVVFRKMGKKSKKATKEAEEPASNVEAQAIAETSEVPAETPVGMNKSADGTSGDVDMKLSSEDSNTVEEDGKRETVAEKIAQFTSVQLALQQLRPNAPAAPKRTKATEPVEGKKQKRERSGSSATHQSATQTPDEPAKVPGGATGVSSSTIEQDFSIWHVDQRLAEAIKEQFGITNFFQLQQYAIKAIIKESQRDVCVSAPTGSGKTLIYAVPMIHALSKRIVTRCRALVILPSRELARQVYEVILPLAGSLGLKSALLAGDSSLYQEGKSLVVEDGVCDRFESLVDIVVATPGRLLDHVGKTKGFTLEHLEYLVVDEADRMLKQSYNDWLDRIYHAANKSESEIEWGNRGSVIIGDDGVVIPSQRSFRPLVSSRISVADYVEQDGKPLRRILCSATLTNNPQKLAALALQRPLLLDSRSLFAGDDAEDADVGAGVTEKLPKTLTELEYKVTSANKPVVLLHLLGSLLSETQDTRVLIFASTLGRTARIHSLLSKVFGKKTCALISSEQSKRDRAAALEAFKNRTVRVLIASDLAARGIDIPGLEYVVSYDVPAHTTTYVHRAGRTARAGLPGTSIVLLRSDQARHFRQIKVKLNLPALQLKVIEHSDFEEQQKVFDEWKASVADSGASEGDAD